MAADPDRPAMRIEKDDLSGEAVRALLDFHFRDMRAGSPPGTAYVLDLSGLTAPEVTLWTIWEGDNLLGCAALKEIASGGEIKSMRTHPDHLRKGAGAALLDHIIGEARRRAYKRLSLETGTGPAFEPALALYRKRGFRNGAVFGEYRESAFNQFLHLDL